MGGAYAMGAPWMHYTGHCHPEWGRDLGDWLAKMTGYRGPRGQQGFGQWEMFGGSPFRTVVGRASGMARAEGAPW